MKSPVLVVLVLLSAAAAWAQTESARISGRITDLTGDVIVGAQCEITNLEVQDSAIVNSTHTPNRAVGFRPKFHGADGKPTFQGVCRSALDSRTARVDGDFSKRILT